MDMMEIRRRARQQQKGCHVCPQCDGRVCSGKIPGFGGMRTGRSFQRNIEALAAYGLVMNSMGGTLEPKTEVTLFDKTFAFPVLAAPLGAIALNCGWTENEEDREYEYVEAICGGAADCGLAACTGDGGLPFVYQAGIDMAGRFADTVIPTIKPRDDAAIITRIWRAVAAGALAVACDIDAATLINMRLLGQPVEPKSPESIEAMVKASSLPFIVKGIMSPQEAQICVDAGVAAIVVSNHGGRALDGMAGTADVLPEIAAAVKGQIHIFVDGGVRHGEDVLKMLALGADAVLIGRPLAIAAIGGGREGVKIYLKNLYRELCDAMLITGVTDINQVDISILRKLTPREGT